MTTLAAIQGDGFAVIGGDSQSSDGDGFTQLLPHGKIFENNGIVFGGAGDVRGINILQHDWSAPKLGRSNPDKFITRSLIPSMRRAFVEAGYEINKSDSSVINNNIWIVIIDCNVYRIDEDYSWEKCVDNIYVAGSGESFALGALTALDASSAHDVEEAEEIIREAIRIAIKWDAFSGGDITTVIKCR